MEPIFGNNFIEYLKEKLGGPVVIRSNNIVCRCPWCEINSTKKHYHCYISKYAPVFNCFHADCRQKGTISKLIRKIDGSDVSDKFIDVNVLEKNKKHKIYLPSEKKEKQTVICPTVVPGQFKYKEDYIKRRIRFQNISIFNLKGLIFDINKFIEMNNITIDSTLLRIKDYLQSNFVGFLTENSSFVMLRNVDPRSTFKFFKLKIKHTFFLDYYQLLGENKKSNHVVLAEGIFDILSEWLFDSTESKPHTYLYASALTTSYDSLIKSIVYNNQIFRLNVSILSDRDININYYKKIKRFNKHIIDKLTIYYNKSGKDFGDIPICPEKFII